MLTDVTVVSGALFNPITCMNAPPEQGACLPNARVTLNRKAEPVYATNSLRRAGRRWLRRLGQIVGGRLRSREFLFCLEIVFIFPLGRKRDTFTPL